MCTYDVMCVLNSTLTSPSPPTLTLALTLHPHPRLHPPPSQGLIRAFRPEIELRIMKKQKGKLHRVTARVGVR